MTINGLVPDIELAGCWSTAELEPIGHDKARAPSMRVEVKPKSLRWARERAGLGVTSPDV